MQFREIPKLELDKSWSLDDTIARLEETFRRSPHFEYQIVDVTQVAEYIWHCRIKRTWDNQCLANGKGIKEKAARASVMSELAERLSAAPFHNSGGTVPMPAPHYDLRIFKDYILRKWLPGSVEAHQSALESDGIDILPIEEVLGTMYDYSKEQYDQLKELQGAQLWCDAWDALNDRVVKIPQHLLHTLEGTNGMAGGNTMEEAIIQAANEVLERYWMIDALYTRAEDLPTIDKSTITDRVAISQIEFMERSGLKFDIKDLSHGMPINAPMIALADNPTRARYTHIKRTTVSVHAGVSFNSDIALQRTMTECFQGMQPRHFCPSLAMSNYEIDEEHGLSHLARYGYANTDLGHLKKGDVIPYKANRTKSFKQDYERLKGICRELGVGFYIMDMTHAELQWPAVTVFMPGLKYTQADLNVYEDPLTMWRKDREYEAMFQRFWRSYFREERP